MILFINNYLQLSSHVKKSFKLDQKVKLIWIKGILRFIHEERKFKGLSGFMVECSVVF